MCCSVGVCWHGRSATSIQDVWIKYLDTTEDSKELLLILLLLYLILIYRWVLLKPYSG